MTSFSHSLIQKREVDRYIGLVLGGAKSDRTCLTVIDFYKKQEKAFVVDVFESITADTDQTSDQALLELINEIAQENPSGIKVLATDAPLTLPPCFLGCDTECEGYEKCTRKEVRWMERQYHKAKLKNKKTKHFTPYSQRPVDLYFRYQFDEIFQDETLGANLAPQTARMQYLQRRINTQMALVEVWPKLVLFTLQKTLKLTKREILDYRNLERGLLVRERLIERLIEHSGIFIYERDMKKMVANAAAFESFICAWVAKLHDMKKVVRFKGDLPLETGWVELPE